MIVYSYFEKGCQKKCLRQSQKVEFTGLQRNLKKWEITTPMVIFDDRSSSTVVNHLLRLHVNLCQIPYMTKHALIITRTLQTGLPLRAGRGRGFPSATFIATKRIWKQKIFPVIQFIFVSHILRMRWSLISELHCSQEYEILVTELTNTMTCTHAQHN